MFRSNHCLRRREYIVSVCLIWCDIVSCFKGAQNFSRGCTVQLLFMNCEYSALHCSFPVLNKRPNLYSTVLLVPEHILCTVYYIKRLLRLKYKIDYYIKKEKLPSTVHICQHRNLINTLHLQYNKSKQHLYEYSILWVFFYSMPQKYIYKILACASSVSTSS